MMDARVDEALPTAWWAESSGQVAAALGTDPERGLTGEQAAQSRAAHGSNALRRTGRSSVWALLLASVRSPVILLLLAVAGVALLLAQYRTAIVMAFVVAVYVAVELINKARSDRIMARLRELQTPRTQVVRDGARQEIPLAGVVVGDLLPLQAGSRVPADARLLSSAGLLVDESLLTGESASVQKDATAHVPAAAPVAERPTMVFAGTTVRDGEGRAVVTAVGTQTELGKVARLAMAGATAPTPLQREMNDLARTLAVSALIVSFLVPLVGLLRGYGLQQMILTWLSLTFLMIPGQPPIIITLALALAAIELARARVVVRRLQGAETLGAVTTLLSDKTGTMTTNQMTLAAIVLGDGTVGFAAPRTGAGERDDALLAGFLAHALPAIPENTNDPTDTAILAAARAVPGFVPPQPGRLVRLTGFATGGSYRALEYEQDGRHVVYVAGNPEYLLDRAVAYWTGEGTEGLEAGQRERLRARLEELAAQGKRVTAYGYGSLRSDDFSRSFSAPWKAGERTTKVVTTKEETDLTLTGLAVLEDPVRPEVRGAIAQLGRAGVRTVMVTGDIPATALAVARQVGLSSQQALAGPQLAEMSDTLLLAAVREGAVFARTAPDGKLRLVRALQAAGGVVAVTGDGVNDAPALHTADVGIAMGERGTDVAREAADLILIDDNLAHIVDGVAAGRKAYDNFRKGITYYLSAKAILLLAFLIPLAVGVPFPFAPIQIIAIELLMDLASSTIFVGEAPEPGTMDRPPRPRTRFLSRRVGLRILRNLLGLTAALLVAYFVSLSLGYGLASARTAALATWLLGHIWLAMNLKQERLPLLRQGLLANRFAAGWLVGMIVLVVAMTTLPAAGTVLNTTPLAAAQWVMAVGGAFLASAWIEVSKWVRWQGR